MGKSSTSSGTPSLNTYYQTCQRVGVTRSATEKARANTNGEAREEAFFVELRDKPKELPQTATKVKFARSTAKYKWTARGVPNCKNGLEV